MNKLVRFIIFFLPVTCFIALGQISESRRQLLATLFLLFSLLSCVIPINPAQETISAWIKAFRSGLLMLALLFSWCSFFPVGGYLAQPLMLEHSTAKAQAIFVLASGVTRAGDPNYSGMQRVTHGINLLKQGQAPKLFISTGFSSQDQHAEAAWVASYTNLFEIPGASFSLLISPEIVTTATEAQYAFKILSQMGIHDILLVTSGAHIYRSCATFTRAGFTSVKPAPVHDKNSVLYANESFISSFHAAVHEWIGLFYYKLRQRI